MNEKEITKRYFYIANFINEYFAGCEGKCKNEDEKRKMLDYLEEQTKYLENHQGGCE